MTRIWHKLLSTNSVQIAIINVNLNISFTTFASNKRTRKTFQICVRFNDKSTLHTWEVIVFQRER